MKGAGLPLVVMAGVACGGPQTTSPTIHRSAADELVRRVQEAYRHRPQLTCRFRQTAFNRTFGLPSMRDGRLYFRRPSDVRLDYLSKRDSTQVDARQIWNGKTIRAVSGKWHYRVSQSRSTLPISLAFLAGPELASKFNARLLTGSAYGNASDSVLELTPKRQSAGFKSLVLVVDPTSSWVKRSIVTTTTGDTNELAFYDPDVNRNPSRRAPAD